MQRISSVTVLILLLVLPSLSHALTPQEEDILRKGGVSEERLKELGGAVTRPDLYDWNCDGLKDIIAGTASGELNVYVNSGSNASPVFEERIVPEDGDVDAGTSTVPCAVDWDGDGLNDIIMGNLQGTIYIYLNTGTPRNPRYATERKLNGGGLDAGSNSAPAVVDWDGDGRKDLVVGNAKGEVLLYLNTGTDKAPAFKNEPVKTGMKVIGYATPFIQDKEGGTFDIVCGSSDGQVWLFSNAGSRGSPSFSTPLPVRVNGDEIKLPGRSTVAAIDWDDDGKQDLLVSCTPEFNAPTSYDSDFDTPAPPARGKYYWDGTTAAASGPGDSRTKKVYLLKNTGTDLKPVYREGVEILRSKYDVNL